MSCIIQYELCLQHKHRRRPLCVPTHARSHDLKHSTKLTDKIILSSLVLCERWSDVRLFVLNQRVSTRRAQPFTGTFKRRLFNKTSLIDQCLAPGVATPHCNYGVVFVAATKDVVSWSVIMRSRLNLLTSGPVFMYAKQMYSKRTV